MRSKYNLTFFMLIVVSIVISSCTALGSPSDTIESYLQAIVEKDEIQAVNLSCAGWEEQAQIEAAAYQGVDVEIENLSCELIEQIGDKARVECDGQIVFSYGSGEAQVNQLKGRFFNVVLVNSEWRMCGMGSSEALSPTEIIESNSAVSNELEVVEPTSAPSNTTGTIAPTDVSPPSSTATPDLRLDPLSWKTWPIIPTLSPWLYDVYDDGIALGNNPQAFSKIGDCQNIPNAFLGIYEKEGFEIHQSYVYLQDTIDFFAGSWGRDSISVDGGFNFPAVFSSLRADPEICNAGETPIECEIRLNEPTFVIIAMEFYYAGRTADNYKKYLEQTVDYVLSQNVIPILATKADNMEGDHSLNLATAQVAYEYDIPLWNFWLAAQSLPNGGIDWENYDEGFHITFDGWDLRSFTALQVIDSLYSDLQTR